MGSEDIRRQKPNVFSMKLMGAEIQAVESGWKTLRDAVNEAMRDWMSSVEDTHYIIGSVIGPHPFPMMVRIFNPLSAAKLEGNALKLLRSYPIVLLRAWGVGVTQRVCFTRLLMIKSGWLAWKQVDVVQHPVITLRHSFGSGCAARQLQLRDAG